MGVAGEDLGMGIQGVLLCLWRLYRCVRTNMSAEPDFPPSEIITRLSWHRNRNGNGHERSVEERTPRLEAMASDRPTIDVYTIRQTSRRHRHRHRHPSPPFPPLPSPLSYLSFPFLLLGFLSILDREKIAGRGKGCEASIRTAHESACLASCELRDASNGMDGLIATGHDELPCGFDRLIGRWWL